MIVPVANSIFQKCEDYFSSIPEVQLQPVDPNEEQLASFITRHNCKAVVLSVDHYSDALYRALPPNGLILRFGVGVDGIDFNRAREKGILVANTPGVLERSVAEHAIFLMGALARHTCELNQAMQAGKWINLPGEELASLKLGIIGLGAIGSQVAAIAHNGFGMETLICELSTPQQTAERFGMTPTELADRTGYTLWEHQPDRILAQADIVSVHMPLLPSTRQYFNAERFAQFKPGSYFINTSRGGLVVEQALAEALTIGKLAGAALDVFETEPYQRAKNSIDLRSLPNLIMTPHVSSNTRSANLRMAQAVVHNLLSWLKGEFQNMHLC